MKRYGYHRTSTREQHLDRGIAEITAYCENNNLSLECKCQGLFSLRGCGHFLGPLTNQCPLLIKLL